MKLDLVIDALASDLSRSLAGLAPEIVLITTIVLLLLVRLFPGSTRYHMGGLALVGTMAALLLSLIQLINLEMPSVLDSTPAGPLLRLVRTSPEKAVHDDPVDLFAGPAPQPDTAQTTQPVRRNGMLRFDSFTVFFRLFLLTFAALVIWLTGLTGIPDNEDSPDFYTLLLGATLGMLLMVSANHLLMVLIAVEMASLPSYGMAGFLKGRREASEASLKYVVFGAGASGIMLYGISLLVGKYGTAHLPSLGAEIAKGGGPVGGVLLLGLMLVLVGIAFKLSAVPFHFWCPDVFEGAAAEVAAFLSVASKGAALGLLARLTTSLILPRHPPIEIYLGGVIALLAAITATFGNLAAYAQTNLKRLLAFSTIAHAGYMMMPLAAFVPLSRQPDAAGQSALESLTFYLLIYLFMNLGAFAVVALIRNQIRSEDLKDYGGLIRRCPFLTVAMAVFLLSLTGIPPLAGFAAKFRIFAVLYEANLHWLLVIGLANTVFSLFYYVKVLRVMILDEPPPNAPAWTVPAGAIVFCTVLIAANLVVMLVPGAWDAMDSLVQLAVPHLLGSF
ncbi:MAG: NADH-quinone oxidoreductase subunit N [Planctomycetes bacterium]|nr:NADH-quinone oxidoreductase subunit N [Planctomycetota bacterium]